VLLAQLFGSSTLGQAHPMSLALALTLGWAMAIAISLISAMSLLTGALCGVRSQEVGLGWNRRFVGQILLLSIALIGLTYLRRLRPDGLSPPGPQRHAHVAPVLGWQVNSSTWWRCAASNSTRFIWASRPASLCTSASSRISSVGRPASRSRSA
jgi:hypothetical protein